MNFSVFQTVNHPKTNRQLNWAALQREAKTPVNQADKLKQFCLSAHSCTEKTKAAVLAHNTMTLAWADIDKGNPDLEALSLKLATLGISSYILYTSYSSTPNAKKWRVLIELAKPLEVDEWATLQRVLTDALDGDTCTENPAQVLFLPSVREGYDYAYKINEGQPLDITENGRIKGLMHDNLMLRANAAKPTPRLAKTEAMSRLYELVNDAYDWEELLLTNGYAKCGDRWKYPSSKNVAGVTVKDDKYFSHHTSDPLSNGFWRDKYDFIVQWRFNGDAPEAFRVLANELDPEGQKQRQRDYMADKAVTDAAKDLATPGDSSIGFSGNPLKNLGILSAKDGTDTSKPLTELGNAHRLLDEHKGKVHYVSEAKTWLHWTNGAWGWDTDDAKVCGLASELPDKIYAEGCVNLGEADYFVKWARASQTKRSITAAVSLFRDFEQVRLTLATVDADPFKVGFDNARKVIDLRTGRSRAALPGDFVTKSLQVDRVGESAKATRWQAFLMQIFNDDREAIDWLKRWCGYMLTGATSEQFLIFGFGSGANGKSVLADVLRHVMGDYCRVIAIETLTDTKRNAGAASPDLANLVGARMAICSETEDGAALAESLVKGLVSGDAMTARKLHCEPFQFTPSFKLMMLGNHKPIVRGNDYGIWRRIKLLPFNRTFTTAERDPNLIDKLKAETPDILAWMLEGCIDWQARGLSDVPTIVEQATAEYKNDQDLIGAWIDECCKRSPHDEASSTALFTSYKAWCVDNGIRASTNITFGRRLGERGFKKRKSHGIAQWTGLTVRCPFDDEPMPF